jgi:translation initiation factor IF-2
MSIRLNKVTRDLNVGMTTLVEFLQKKGHVVENNPNTKISEEEYELLVKEFSKDMTLKQEAERLVHERINRDRQKTETTAAESAPVEVVKPVEEVKPVEVIKPVDEVVVKEEPRDAHVQIKTVGHIDLDAFKTKSKPVQPAVSETVIEKAKPKEPAVPVKEPKSAKPAAEEPVKPTTTERHEAKKPVAEEQPKEVPNVEKASEKLEISEKKVAERVVPKEEEVFKLGINKLESNIKVIKTIDLDALNQSTRPKKKTQAEKKKEREEKQASVQKTTPGTATRSGESTFAKPNTEGGSDAGFQKKKRSRIKDGKVKVSDVPSPGGARSTQSSQDIKSRLKKPVLKSEVSTEDVSKQVKETLARLTSKPKKGTKYRRDKREAGSQRRQEEAEQERLESQIIKITEFVTVNDLANMMDVPVVQVISTCMSIGQMVSINQRLDAETINFVADEFGFKTEYVSAEVMEAIQVEEDSEEDLVPRSPIVTVMGHVDHGKTSLLDYIRDANVIAGEAGGITQHIGAYNVQLEDGRKITFLDTPGHEAFTAMRARGAKVTDIAIIIVAADDNVMPQTIEAINHASAANVPMLFAINKIDKPGADPEKIKDTLAQMNYLVEDWGGKYQSQDISAKKGINVKELLEKVLLEAEMLELKANPKKKAIGSVIESSLDKGRGYVATVLVHNGTLKMGDIVIAGVNHGRIKAMFNERGQRVDQAGPSEPVLILGLNGAPQAGDNFNVVATEQEAREIASKREQLQREQGLRTNKLLTLAEIGRRIAVGNFRELNVIVKGDVDGSIEALSDSLIKLSTEEIQVNVIHKAVGAISESDVTLASASDAIIVGFQVRPSQAARRLAEKEGVDMHMYSIIYDAIEEVKSAMEGMLSPDIKEEITATIEVRDVFKITKVGTVAGCMVKEGKVKRGNKLRLIRDGIVIYTGEMGALKRFKEEVKEVNFGYECGLSFANYQDLQVGDIVESFEEIEVRKSL